MENNNILFYLYKCLFVFLAYFRCVASGDPHFYSYDGVSKHFQGNCRYKLSGTVSSYQGNAFSVIVTNENRNGNTRVSFVREVEVIVKGYKIQLIKGRQIKVFK